MAADVASVAWDQFGRALHGFIRRRVDSPEDADEILQDVMLRVHRAAAGGQAGERLRPWVYGIARNAIIDHYRARAARGVSVEVPDDLSADPAGNTALGELTGCLAPVLAALPPAYAEALRLADLEGLTQQEVADRLGLSLSGTKARVQRARRMVRGDLEKCCRLSFGPGGALIDATPTGRGPAC
ncbi:MAG: sigma-70 family RNA polymerase sigma factor [Rhodospirillaceae bacterium]